MSSDINAGLLRSFLDEKGVREQCPRCGSFEWVVDSDSPWGGFWGANSKDEYSLDSPIHEVLLITCENCGFVSAHAKSIFDKWREAKGK